MFSSGSRRLINGARSQGAGKSTHSWAAASSTHEVATDRSITNGSTDGCSSYNPTGVAHRDDPDLNAWVQSQVPDRLIKAALDAHSLCGSLSLSGSSTSDVPDTGNLPARSERRDTNTGRLARDLNYEAPVNMSHYSKPSFLPELCPEPTCSHTDNSTGIVHEPPEFQEATSCSECDSIFEGIKYVCTTCAAGDEKGNSRDAPASPTRTILGRRFSESSSSTVRAGYELCATCFERVGVDHSSASDMNGSSRTTPTPKELKIARRSAPKRKGQLRHAFVEKFWDHGWQAVGA